MACGSRTLCPSVELSGILELGDTHGLRFENKLSRYKVLENEEMAETLSSAIAIIF